MNFVGGLLAAVTVITFLLYQSLAWMGVLGRVERLGMALALACILTPIVLNVLHWIWKRVGQPL